MSRTAWLGWAAVAAFAVAVATGPASGPSGLHVLPTWTLAAIVGAGAIVIGRLECEWPRGLRAGVAASLAAVAAVFAATVGRDVGMAIFGPGRALLYGGAIVAAAGSVGVLVGWAGRWPIGEPGAWARALPRMLLPVMAVAAFLVVDLLEVSRGGALRDLRLYLLAGQHALDGAVVYRTAPLTELFDDPALYPFLYPPPVIPLVGILAALPYPLVAGAWVLGSVAAFVAGLRALGVRWVWVPVLAAWPGAFVGLWAGNVAILAFLLFAVALRAPALLAIGPLFKLQLAIPSLWLFRERRWSAALAGGGLVVALGVASLPLVGAEAWAAWWAALRAFQASQEAFPALYAFALPAALPYAAFLGLAIASVGWAIRGRDRDGLARLGVAAVVASPSLYRHGFLSGLPQVLRLDAALVWLVLGAGLSFNALWLGLVLAAAAVVVPALRAEGADPLHPLGPDGLWPLPRHRTAAAGVVVT